MKIVKHVVGIDVSSETFDVCFKAELEDQQRITKGTRSFENNAQGFRKYLDWCLKRNHKEVGLTHILEATGVYHENLCYYLHNQGEQVCVLLPQKVKYFIKSLNVKTKTDTTDAKAIAEYGLCCKFQLWEPLSENFKHIRDLCRTVSQLKKSKGALQSQLHALNSSHNSNKEGLGAMEHLVNEHKKSIKECEAAILALSKEDKGLWEKVERITEIKGVQALTVLKLLAETDGFRKVGSIKKLVSYAGLDVIENQSGSRQGKTRISKKGNTFIREALYMPALCATQHNKNMRAFYEMLEQRQATSKQGVVAVMRKLLVVIYSLWKSGRKYNENHEWKEKGKVSLARRIAV
ncbi:MAG: IS110 family transposase [Chitinophagales bacterium]